MEGRRLEVVPRWSSPLRKPPPPHKTELNKTAGTASLWGFSHCRCAWARRLSGSVHEVQVGLEGWNKSEGNRAQPGVRTT